MANIVERYTPYAPLTMTVGATPVVGGDVVELSGAMTVIPAAADSVKAVGIAMTDGAVGAKIPVWPLGGVVLTLTASGAIAAGDRLVCAANGDVKLAPTGSGAYTQAETTFYQRTVGIALEAIANGQTGRVLAIS